MADSPPYPQWLAREERKAERHGLALSGTATGARMIQQPVEMVDLSPLGCRLRVVEPMRVGSYIILASGTAPLGAARLEGWVAWSRPSECGIDFARPVPGAVVEQITARAAT